MASSHLLGPPHRLRPFPELANASTWPSFGAAADLTNTASQRGGRAGGAALRRGWLGVGPTQPGGAGGGAGWGQTEAHGGAPCTSDPSPAFPHRRLAASGQPTERYLWGAWRYVRANQVAPQRIVCCGPPLPSPRSAETALAAVPPPPPPCSAPFPSFHAVLHSSPPTSPPPHPVRLLPSPLSDHVGSGDHVGG